MKDYKETRAKMHVGLGCVKQTFAQGAFRGLRHRFRKLAHPNKSLSIRYEEGSHFVCHNYRIDCSTFNSSWIARANMIVAIGYIKEFFDYGIFDDLTDKSFAETVKLYTNGR